MRPADISSQRPPAPSAVDKDPKTYAIIGAAMEVHRELGHGFLETVYQEALAIELSRRRIPFEREIELLIRYKQQPLKTRYRAAFICHNSIVVETRTLPQLSSLDQGQIINELKAAGISVGLLLNFGAPALDYRRVEFVPRPPAPPGPARPEDRRLR